MQTSNSARKRTPHRAMAPQRHDHGVWPAWRLGRTSVPLYNSSSLLEAMFWQLQHVARRCRPRKSVYSPTSKL